MHKVIKNSLCVALLASCSAGLAVAPYYSIRSQSENIARELVGAGWNTQINLCDMDKWYGNFSITPEYTRSFRPCRIAQCLFGCSNNSCTPCGTTCCTPCGTTCGTTCCTTCDTACCTPCGTTCCDDDCYRIRISGSQVANRSACDWMADNFGLPTDYQSCVTFEPRIDNFLVDFNFYVGFDEWCKGMFFRIHAPVVKTRWNLGMCECGVITGTNNHMAGYFNKTVVEEDSEFYGILRNKLVSNFTSFISGCDCINSSDITFNKLCYAKMDCCKKTETALADIRMILGWNFWCDEDYNVGLGIHAAAPTGNSPDGCYLFEPIVGNGKHWELGGHFTSNWIFWRSEDEECNCGFYLDANVTHLFKAKQCRVFDLCCKPLSRYMLAAKFKTTGDDLYAGASAGNVAKPCKQFEGIYTPVANLTYMPVDVSVGVQGDVALMFQYQHKNWAFDLGYNFWGRSCEKIECCCPCFAENTWALKGDSFSYGFTTTPLTNAQVGVALSASQSCATIFCGRNVATATTADPFYKNPGVDNKALAWNDSGGTAPLYTVRSDNTYDEQVYTSKDPVFIKPGDIDKNGARTKGISHKLFAHFDYTWADREDWIPFLGVGGEVEFAQTPGNDCNDSCGSCCTPCSTSCCDPCGTCCSPCGTGCCSPCDSSCASCCSCALSQWGIWLKGGVAFN